MLLRLCEMLMRPSGVRRGIAVFFILFTLADMVAVDIFGPRPCLEDAERLPLVVANSAQSNQIPENQPSHLAIIQHTDRNQPLLPGDETPPEQSDEDCFCCCSHVMPGIRVDIATLNCSPQPGEPVKLSLPSSPLRGTFHPPRLS
ncbi:MAG TPA: hypothetical protein VJ302_35315 [Blastocatellia bacterium]|nr:hypothetical protein [Blastocatellia bacterium]